MNIKRNDPAYQPTYRALHRPADYIPNKRHSVKTPNKPRTGEDYWPKFPSERRMLELYIEWKVRA